MDHKLIIAVIGVILVLVLARVKRTLPQPIPTADLLPRPPIKVSGPILTMSIYNLGRLLPPLPRLRYNSMLLLVNPRNGIFTLVQAGRYRINVRIQSPIQLTIYVYKFGYGPIANSSHRPGSIDVNYDLTAKLNDSYYIIYHGSPNLVVPIARVTVTQLDDSNISPDAQANLEP